MEYFRGATAMEVITVRVDAGEDLLASMQRAVTECGIHAGAVLSGLGCLERIHLEVPANLAWPPAVVVLEKQGPGQIVSAGGLIAGAELDLYLTVAKRNEVFAGRVTAGSIVLHPVELVLLRAGGTRWARVPDPNTGMPLLEASQPPTAAIRLMGQPVDPEAVALVPRSLLRRHGCLPVARSADTLIVAMTDPNNPFALDDLREATGLRIQAVAVPARELVPALHQALAGP